MDASTFQRLHPRAYLERFVVEGYRPDGREMKAWREASVNVGSISTADGSALVRLGNTTIVCGVKAEIAEPDLDRPDEGFIVPNLDLPAICSPKFKAGPPNEESQVLSERLNDVLVSSGVISPSSLCIHSGHAVWVLYIDATCVNYDGNAFDAALLAVMAALRNTRLPKATFDEDSLRTTCSRSVRERLQINRSPLAASFGIFDGAHLLSDLSSFEEPLIETTLTVIVDENGDLASLSQVGFGSLQDGKADSKRSVASQEVVSRCVAAAKERRQALGVLLDQT